jgi:hypothetical protein
MSKTIVFTALFTCLCITALAQRKNVVQGLVMDSLTRSPLGNVTVGVSGARDSNYVSYTSTTSDGNFVLSNLPVQTPLVLFFSCIGYGTQTRFLMLQKGEKVDIGKILMKLKSQMLGDVIIEGRRQAVVIKGDTIEFNTAAFRTRPNAAVEDLLKKIPGIQVDNSGTILVYGKAISKIMVDGKEFFTNDPRIASRSLDAESIDKVQIYDDKDDSSPQLIYDANTRKIINLKLKKSFKKSVFGKTYAGAGSRDRFETGVLINTFRDTLQASLLGLGNNLNKTGFSSRDLSNLGGFNRSGLGLVTDGSVPIGSSNNSGIEKILSGGLNLNNDYGNKLKINLLYFFSRAENVLQSTLLNRQFPNTDTLLNTSTNNTYTSIDNKHNISGQIIWKPDSLRVLKYTPQLSFTRNQSFGNDLTRLYSQVSSLSQKTSDIFTHDNQTRFQHLFSFSKRLKKAGEFVSISHSLNVNPDDNEVLKNQELVSQVASIGSQSVHRLSLTQNQTVTASVNINYNYPLLKRLNGEVAIGQRYEFSNRHLETFDKNSSNQQYDIILSDQSTSLTRKLWTESVKFGLVYSFTRKLIMESGITNQWQNLSKMFQVYKYDGRGTDYYLLPYMRIRYDKLTFSFNSTIVQPSLINLMPVTLQTTKLYSFVGNPLLVASKNNVLDLSYNTYNPQLDRSFFVNLTANFEDNSTTFKNTLTSDGASSTTPINRSGKYNLNANVSFSQKLKTDRAWDIRVSPSINIINSRDFFILNNDQGYQNNMVWSFTQNSDINWNNRIEFIPSYTLSSHVTRYSEANFEPVRYVSHNFKTKFIVWGPKKIYWESIYSFVYNPLSISGFRKSVNLLNASAAMQILKKDRGEIKLSCYDILNQNINTYTIVGTNSISDFQSQILNRYFLLTFMVKFNKAAK